LISNQLFSPLRPTGLTDQEALDEGYEFDWFIDFCIKPVAPVEPAPGAPPQSVDSILENGLCDADPPHRTIRECKAVLVIKLDVQPKARDGGPPVPIGFDQFGTFWHTKMPQATWTSTGDGTTKALSPTGGEIGSGGAPPVNHTEAGVYIALVSDCGESARRILSVEAGNETPKLEVKLQVQLVCKECTTD
jgi:hypothetical protein